MAYTNIWETVGLHRKFTKEITSEEILLSNIELHTDSGFGYIQYIINDFTDVTGYSIEALDINAYAISDDIISVTKGKLKIALVVTQAPLIELAKNYCELMSGKRFECELFQSLDDARNWVKSVEGKTFNPIDK